MSKVCVSHFDKECFLNYEKMEERLAAWRASHPERKLTYAEKMLYGHLDNPEQGCEKLADYLYLRPDRVAMQDATAQMAVLQFMSSGIPRVAVPTTVHADHLIACLDQGGEADLAAAKETNKEVYAFLSTAAAKYGMGFWGPGSGIIHQIVLENYAFPGGMMIGTDSHTPNAGGLGMIAVGIGGADAVDVMAGLPLELKAPKIIGVHLTGKLQPWVTPKDVILKIAGLLTVAGGTGCIVEYFGPGVEALSATGQATICNMGAEVGATCSVFPYNKRQDEFLRATGRADIADLAAAHKAFLSADCECPSIYDKVVELNLDELIPQINGPASPDRNTPITQMAEMLEKTGFPQNLTACLIGSCTNSSYEDLSAAAEVCRQAAAHGMKAKTKFYISPGSEQIRATIERDGIAEAFRSVGGVIISNSCGPCIGQWKRTDIEKGFKNSIIHSYNRNFVARADGNKETQAFIGSPAIVTAFAIAGKLTFDPRTDVLVGANGEEWKLTAPVFQPLPAKGYDAGADVYVAPSTKPEEVEILINPESERICLLQPFEKWDGKDYADCAILIKAKGKVTTDHISPAGPWLRYRGHIDKISNNLLLTAVNAENGEMNNVRNQLTGEFGTISEAARGYKAAGKPWVIIGDTNYGEGSSREHAAIEPRYLGGVAVIARSFARIHESNLKKQGVLAFTFADSADYDKIRGDDRLTFNNLAELAPGKQVIMTVKPADGSAAFDIPLNHTMNEAQISWFRAGSALNELAAMSKK